MHRDTYKERDWGKHGLILAYLFGFFAIVFSILSYVRPPDPSHPVIFDFLSMMIAVPFWEAVMQLLAVAALTFALTRKFINRGRSLSAPVIAVSRALDSLSVLDKKVTDDQDDPSIKHNRKVWITLRNDGKTCLKLEDPEWKSGNLQANIIHPDFNLNIDNAWLPFKKGRNPICLAPGARCRLWLEPISNYSVDELRSTCESPTRIGVLSLKLNGESVEIPV